MYLKNVYKHHLRVVENEVNVIKITQHCLLIFGRHSWKAEIGPSTSFLIQQAKTSVTDHLRQMVLGTFYDFSPSPTR